MYPIEYPPEIRAQVAAIERISPNDSFKIEDAKEKEGLYLTHYEKNANIIKNGQNRGLIVDLNHRLVVCASYAQTPNVVADRIEYPESGILQYADRMGIIHQFEKDKTIFKLGVEGFVVRAFLHNGKVYLSTHRKIEVRHTNARWGTSKPFWIMMDELGFYDMLGIDKDKNHQNSILFPTGKLYSPYVHLFMISHPKMIYVSKQNVDKGYVSYLGALKLWDPQQTTIPMDEIETDVYSPSNVTHDMAKVKAGGYFFVPNILTVEQVNEHLSKGFYPNEKAPTDPRLGMGEYVIAYTEDKNAWPAKIVSIQSTAYSWRASIRGEHANLFYQFFNLGDAAKIDTKQMDNLIEFKRRFPIVDRYNPEEIIKFLSEGRAYIRWPQEKVSDSFILTADDRFYNIWVCYLLAVPLNQQYEISLMYREYFKSRNRLIDYLYKIYLEGTYDQLDYDGFAYIINLATAKVNRIYDKEILIETKFQELMKKSLIEIVNNTEGSFLYKLMRNAEY